MALNREQILAIDDCPKKEVFVPQWNDTVWIRTMNAGERDAFEAEVFGGEKPNMKGMRQKLVALTAINPDGSRMFSLEDVEALERKNAAAIDVLFEAAQEWNRMNRQGMEEAEKN